MSAADSCSRASFAAVPAASRTPARARRAVSSPTTSVTGCCAKARAPVTAVTSTPGGWRIRSSPRSCSASSTRRRSQNSSKWWPRRSTRWPRSEPRTWRSSSRTWTMSAAAWRSSTTPWRTATSPTRRSRRASSNCASRRISWPRPGTTPLASWNSAAPTCPRRPRSNGTSPSSASSSMLARSQSARR